MKGIRLIKEFAAPGPTTLYRGRTSLGNEVEFVLVSGSPDQPDRLIISTMIGCPVGCRICDAGSFWRNKLTVQEMFEQIDYVVNDRFEKYPLKIEFSRMGEPALNDTVLVILEQLPSHLGDESFSVSICTTAPFGRERFFESLLKIKQRLYLDRLELRFSIHSTNTAQRDSIIPIKKWNLKTINQIGSRFAGPGRKKVFLHFVVCQDSVIDPRVLKECFDPEKFSLTFSPLNPTCRAQEGGMISQDPDSYDELIGCLRQYGFDVLILKPEDSDFSIGGGYGQHAKRYLRVHPAH